MHFRTPCVVGVALVLVSFLCASGCGKNDAKPKGDAKGSVGEKLQLAGVKPDVSMDAKAWLDEWTKDADGAQRKYKGKLIELSGEVSASARLRKPVAVTSILKLGMTFSEPHVFWKKGSLGRKWHQAPKSRSGERLQNSAR